jgi:aerobic-type carbon monoxide dehydrogenase small subunit (CoxS/CutS family)
MKVLEEPTLDISCTINGDPVRAQVTVRQNLVDFVRHEVGLTGSHVGCEHGICGACHIVVDGRVVRGCLMLAVQANGSDVVTIESSHPTAATQALQAAFYERAALQCGFCTPGMILQASELLGREPSPTRRQIREALSGNYCRCTGYHAIVDAVEIAAGRLRQRVESDLSDRGSDLQGE